MGKRIKWTDEMIREAALVFNTRSAFCKGNNKAYNAARGRGILDEVCQHMKQQCITWTSEMIFDAASKFRTRSEFRNNPAYNRAIYHGILDQVCAHMDYQVIYWTDEMLTEAAKVYNTRGEFQKGNRKAYDIAHMRGLLDTVCSHMQAPPEMTDWTDEMIFNAASKFDTRYAFQKGDQAAYFAAYRRGIVDEICTNMERGIFGFNPGKPGQLYIVRLYNQIHSYIGFGISNDYKHRLTQHTRTAKQYKLSLSVMKIIEFENGKDAADLELKLKRYLPIVDVGMPGFQTEAILASDYHKLEEIIYAN